MDWLLFNLHLIDAVTQNDCCLIAETATNIVQCSFSLSAKWLSHDSNLLLRIKWSRSFGTLLKELF